MSDDDLDLTETEQAFLTAFDAHARASDSELAVDFLDTFHVESALVLCLHIGAEGVLLLTAGVHIDGGRLRADELHNQLCTLLDEPTSMALDVTGSPDELAQAALSWFERLLRRPIERWEWVYDGGVYAYEYVFTDTGEGLVAMHNRLFGPPTGGPLGPPDRTVRIRG